MNECILILTDSALGFSFALEESMLCGLFVNTANDSPSHRFICTIPVLSHKNVVASEASNSRLVFVKDEDSILKDLEE